MPTRGPQAAPCPPQLTAVQPHSPRPACRSCSSSGLSPTAWSALPRPHRRPPLPTRAATVFLAQPSRHRAGTAPRCNLSPSSLRDLLRLPRPPSPSPLLLPPYPAEKGHKSSPSPPETEPRRVRTPPPPSPLPSGSLRYLRFSPRGGRPLPAPPAYPPRAPPQAPCRLLRTCAAAAHLRRAARGARPWGAGGSEGQRGRARVPLRGRRDWPVRREGWGGPERAAE